MEEPTTPSETPPTTPPTPAKRPRRAPTFRCTCGFTINSRAVLAKHIAGPHTDGKTHAKWVAPEQKSRAKRWAEAAGKVTDGSGVLMNMVDNPKDYDKDNWDYAIGDCETGLNELQELHGEYDNWYNNLPEQLQSSPVGEKLSAVIDIDVEPSTPDGGFDVPEGVEPDNCEDLKNWLEEQRSNVDGLESCAQECEGADLPLGFGKD